MPRTSKAPELNDKQRAWLALPQWRAKCQRKIGDETYFSTLIVRASSWDGAADKVDRLLGECARGEVRTIDIGRYVP